jgi:hypothetical protein
LREPKRRDQGPSMRRPSKFSRSSRKSRPESGFHYRLEQHLEFLERVSEARRALREGRGVRLEDVRK